MRESLENVLRGRYTIVRLLSFSHGKQVYLLRHIPTNTLRVAKCIDTLTHTPHECQSEAMILRLLNIPMIPHLHDEIVTKRYYFIIEDYVSGISLEAYVLHQNLSLELFNLICLDLFFVFEYMHTRSTPVYYLDLKPEHIIIRDVGVGLVDFGASVAGGAMPRFRQATKRFAAPELLKCGHFAYDATADIFGLGRTMLFLSQNVSMDDSDELMKIITKACRFDPALRYQCVADMRQDFVRLIT